MPLDDKVSQLTEQFLEDSCQDDYKHDLLDADTPEEKEAEAIKAAYEKNLEKSKRLADIQM